MAFTPLLAQGDYSDPMDTGVLAWPANAQRISVRFDVTPFASKNFPFNSPSKVMHLSIFTSYDGGSTFVTYLDNQAITGSSTGTWGKAKADPIASLIVQPGQPIPTHYRATLTIDTPPISFGLDVEIA